MNTTPKTLTIEECHALLDALVVKEGTYKQFHKGIRNYTMALLMMDAGLRVGEVVQLRIPDLYYDEVSVQNLLVRPEIAKTKTERTVPLSTRIIEALTTHYQDIQRYRGNIEPYFAFHHGRPYRPLTTRQVERIIRAAALKSIGRPVHPHMLRHTFASCIERKAGIRITQELLGHKNLASTQIYTHPNEDDKKKAIDSLNDASEVELQKGMQLFRPAHSPDRIDTGGAHQDHR